MAPSNPVGSCQRFVGTCCLHLFPPKHW
jgi:hypothetical protein